MTDEQKKYFVLVGGSGLVLLVSLLCTIFSKWVWDTFFIFDGVIVIGFSILFVVLVIASLVYLFKTIKKDTLHAIAPLMINLLTVILVFQVDNYMQDLKAKKRTANFFKYLQARNEVVQMVEAGKFLKGNLPQKYLSYTGSYDIWVTNKNQVTYVLFFFGDHFLDSFKGYIYASDNQIPPKSLFGMHSAEYTKVANGWYYLVHY